MSKFDDIINSFSDILSEQPVTTTQQAQPAQPAQPTISQPSATQQATTQQQPAVDISTLDKATGDQIKAGLAEVLGDEAQADKLMQSLVGSSSIAGQQQQQQQVPTNTASAGTTL